MPLAVAPLDGGDDDVEGAQRALDLQPLHAAPARAVRRARVLHHQALVAALARGEEFAVQRGDELVAGGRDRRLAREAQRWRQRQRAQDVVPLGQRQVQERPAVPLEQVEHDKRRGEPLAYLAGHVLSSQAGLERREGHRPLAIEREDLRVEHEGAGDRLDARRAARDTAR